MYRTLRHWRALMDALGRFHRPLSPNEQTLNLVRRGLRRQVGATRLSVAEARALRHLKNGRSPELSAHLAIAWARSSKAAEWAAP